MTKLFCVWLACVAFLGWSAATGDAFTRGIAILGLALWLVGGMLAAFLFSAAKPKQEER